MVKKFFGRLWKIVLIILIATAWLFFGLYQCAAHLPETKQSAERAVKFIIYNDNGGDRHFKLDDVYKKGYLSPEFNKGIKRGVEELAAQNNVQQLCTVVKHLEALGHKNEDIKDLIKTSIQNGLKNDTSRYAQNAVCVLRGLSEENVSYYDNYSVYLNAADMKRSLVSQKTALLGKKDVVSVIQFLVNLSDLVSDQRGAKLIKTSDVLTRDEIGEYCQRYMRKTITQNDRGGYYDSRQDGYESNTETAENGGYTIHVAYEFYGDFMAVSSNKTMYRPTGADWEEEMLSKYDESSVNYYYKEQSVNLSWRYVPRAFYSSTIYVHREYEALYMIAVFEDSVVGIQGPHFDIKF